jgi:hypothetical protein
MICRCPACGVGTVLIQCLDRPPRYRFSARGLLNQCSAGCPAERISEALE